MKEEYQEIDEINLINLMFYCLKRWRWAVVCMVVMAIAAGAYKYQAVIGDNQIKKEKQKEQQLQQTQQLETEAPAEGGTEDSEPIVFEDPVSSAAAFAVVGGIGGIFLVCLLFCMRYIMSGKLQDESNFQEKFGMPLLGTIRRADTKRRWFGFIDHGIRRLEEGPYAKISRKEQIKIAALNVRAAIRKNSEEKMERIMLAGTNADVDITELCEQLAAELEDITFSPYRQIVFHAASLKKLEYYDGILFIEKKGESYEKVIKQEKELAIDRDVKVLGMIIC